MKKLSINLAILVSHPIQYQVPLFLELVKNKDINLTVYFCWKGAVKDKYFDKEFNHAFQWDIPLLHGYKHFILKNFSLKPSSEFFGQINLGILSILFRKKHDAIIVFGWNSLTNWLTFLIAFLNRTPIYIRGENPMNQEYFKKNWKLSIKKIVLGWLFKHSSGILYIGEENKNFYKYYGVPENKLFFTPYAVDNDRLLREAKELKGTELKIKQNLQIKEDSVVILFMGKLINKKRPMDLLRAFELLKKKYLINNASLIFVGDGMLRSDLEEYVEKNKLDNVHFYGFKNQSELSRFYIVSDIFVLPSGSGETWGLVVNEAMCFGLPVVATNIVGCSADLVQNSKNGFVYNYGDIESLSTALKILITEKNLRVEFGEKSFELIQDYSFVNDIKGILEAIIR